MPPATPTIAPTTPNAPLNAFISAVQTQILNPIIVILTFAAFVLFVWGVTEYIRNAADAEKRKDGQNHILWGIIGLVIIFGAQALVVFLKAVAGQLF
jgi:uncharacterized membrane protein YidH (DUF202 family)